MSGRGRGVLKRIMAVFGTRPEAIKMCPVIKELLKRDGAEVRVVLSAQHGALARDVMELFAVVPDATLQIPDSGSRLADITAGVLYGTLRQIEVAKPDIVLVHGDTATAYAAALAAFYSGVPIGHVEAGLRTYNVNSPFPEEMYRRAITLVSVLNFAPTRRAVQALAAEGACGIYQTGNTVIDALGYTVSPSYTDSLCEMAESHPTVLLTVHRRESRGEGHMQILRAAARIAALYPEVRVVLPLHPSPEVRTEVSAALGDSGVIVVPPLSVLAFHNLLSRSYLALTDSGGVQEEAAALGIPVLVCRDTTERGEGIEAGCAELVGTREADVVSAFDRIYNDKEKYRKMASAENPYGTGSPSRTIADILMKGT